MKRLFLLLAIASALVAAAAGIAGAAGRPPSAGPPELAAGVPQGLVHPRNEARPRGGGSPDLLFHGGQIMTSASITAIYWGTSWASSAFVGDKITGLDSFYGGVGGSPYIGTTTEYTDTNGKVTGSTAYGGHLIDTSAAPARAPKTSTILAEVARMITNPVPNGYYPVYVDTPRGHAGYCAWHSWGTINGVQVQFAFFFNLDGDAGCDPQDTSGLHSQGLSALANVSGHEYSEALTDPQGAAWYDSSGAENADKCAWTFGSPLLVFGNGSQWKVQGNWSNSAYDNGQTGYASGGCIDGN